MSSMGAVAAGGARAWAGRPLFCPYRAAL